jgi:hypothetical protein
LPGRYFLNGYLGFRPAALDRCQKRKQTVPCRTAWLCYPSRLYGEFYSVADRAGRPQILVTCRTAPRRRLSRHERARLYARSFALDGASADAAIGKTTPGHFCRIVNVAEVDHDR